MNAKTCQPRPAGMRRRLLAAAAALLSMLALPVCAQSVWPNRPLTIVSPYSAGGITDILCRTIAEVLAKRLGQPVVVENQLGAAGAIAVARVARAAPDGYTFVMAGTPSTTLVPALNPKVGYHPLKDLEPVAYVAGLPSVLVVHPSVPAKTPKELLIYAKANPGRLACGHLGSGGTGHLACLEFARKAEVAVIDVGYKGAPQLNLDLLANRVNMNFSTLPPVLQYLRSGQLRAIGMASPERNQSTPDIPTLAEQGYEGLTVDAWNALYAPAGTPRAVIERMSREVLRALELPEVRARIEATGAVPRLWDAAHLGRLTREEYESWQRYIAETKFQLE